MREGQRGWIALAALFLAAVLLVALLPGAGKEPYSSYSAQPDGTKAAYLLLEELGFQVARNTRESWNGDGELIALGSDYLENPEGVTTIPQDYRFTNRNIEANAEEFVEAMWPYHDSVIVFQEYGRSMYNQSNLAVRDEVTLWGITPDWLRLVLLGGGLIALFLMFFYGQRLGRPLPPKGFTGRKPLEGVYAMAAALEKGETGGQCAAYYYQYQARNGDQWDPEHTLVQELKQVGSAAAARGLMARIDERVKEYRHEGK